MLIQITVILYWSVENLKWAPQKMLGWNETSIVQKTPSNDLLGMLCRYHSTDVDLLLVFNELMAMIQ